MTLAARFNEWLESSGRPPIRSQAEFLEWLERPRSDNRSVQEDPNSPSMTEQFLAWAQKNPSTIQPPAPTQSPTAPAPTLTDRMAAMRMNPIPEKPGGFSLTAALRSRMVGAEVKPDMTTPAKVDAPVTDAPRAKEPWEMTREEYDATPAAKDVSYDIMRESARDAGKTPLGDDLRASQFTWEQWKNTPHESTPAEGPVDGKDILALLDRYGSARGEHAIAVAGALRAGKPVPPEVLADYPDLAAKYGKGAVPSDTAGPSVPSERGAGPALNAKGEATTSEQPAIAPATRPEGSQQPAKSGEAPARKFYQEKLADLHVRSGKPDANSPTARQNQQAAFAETQKQFPHVKTFFDLDKTAPSKPAESPAQPPLNVIRYNATTDAISDASGNIYATVQTGIRRSGQPFYKVEGYSKQAGQHGELEGIYEARGKEEAIEAARAIARRIRGESQSTPARRPGDVETTPVLVTEKTRENVTTEAVQRQAEGQAQEGLLTPTPSAQGDTKRPPAQVESSTTPDGLDPVVWERLGFEASQKGRPYEPPQGPQLSIRGNTSDAMLAAREAYAKGWLASEENKSSGTPPPAQVESTGESKRFGRFSDDVDAIHEAMAAGEKFQLNTYLRSTLLEKPEHIRATASGVQVPEGKGWVTLTDRQVENLKAQAAGAYLRRPLKGLTGNEAKEGVVINRLDAETDRPVTETFRLLQYGDMDAALKAQAEKFVSPSAHANMRSGGISLFVVETPGKEPRIIRAVSKNNDPAGQFRDEMVSRLSGSALMNDAKPGNKNAEKLVQQKAEYESRREARAKQVREEMAREQAEYDTAAKNAADAATKTKFKKQPITVAIEKGKPSTFEANVSGEFAYHRPLGKDGKPERGGGYVVTHVPTGRVVGRDISTTGKAKETIAALQRFFPPGLTDPVKVTDAIRESLGRAEVPLSDFAQAAGRGDAAKLWVIGDRIAESLAGAKEPQRSTDTPSVAPSNTPPTGKGLITDAGDAARVEAAKEVIKKAVKDSQSRLGTLGGTLEPYFNKEFARAVGDLASIYTKAVMRQGYAQLLEYTDAAFGRFKEFLATHLPEHADVLGQVQGGKFLRRVWARAVASQRDLKNLGVAEKKAALRARQGFVEGERVTKLGAALRKGLSDVRQTTERVPLSMRDAMGIEGERAAALKGKDRVEQLKTLDAMFNEDGKIPNVKEAIAALEKAGGKIRNIPSEYTKALSELTEVYVKSAEDAVTVHLMGEKVSIDDFAADTVKGAEKNKGIFDYTGESMTDRIKARFGKKGAATQEGVGQRGVRLAMRILKDTASEGYQTLQNYFGGDAKIMDLVFRDPENSVRVGFTKHDKIYMEAHEPWRKAIEDTGLGKETEMSKFISQPKTYDLAGEKFTMTEDQAAHLYAHLTASGPNRARLLAAGWKWDTETNRKNVHRMTEEQADALVANASERVKKLAEGAFAAGRILDPYRLEMQEKVDFYPGKSRGDRYLPIHTVRGLEASKKADLVKYVAKIHDIADPSFNKPAAEQAKDPFVIEGLTTATRRMIDSQSLYAGIAYPVKKLHSVLAHEDVRDAVVKKYGQGVYDKMEEAIKLWSGYYERPGSDEFSGAAELIRKKINNLTGVYLSFSPRAQVTSNMTGALQYMKEVDARDFNTAAYGLAKDIAAGRYGALREALKENGTLWRRMDTPTQRLLTPTDRFEVDPTSHEPIEWLNKMHEWIGKNFAGRGDDLNTALAYKIAEAELTRLGGDTSHKAILDRAEQLVRLTQNPSSRFDMSVTAMSQRRNLIGQAIFFIQNGALKAKSSWQRSLQKGGMEAVKGTVLAATEVAAGALTSRLWQLATVGSLLPDDDKRMDKKRVIESGLAIALAETADLILPASGQLIRGAFAKSRYGRDPNASPAMDVIDAGMAVIGELWRIGAEATGLRDISERGKPASERLMRVTGELASKVAPFMRIPPQAIGPLRELMREKPPKKPIR